MNTETRGPAAPLYDAVMQALASKGWTKTRLWRESGVARSTIEAWETQPRPPQAGTVHAVADALDMNRTEALRLAGILTVEPKSSPAAHEAPSADASPASSATSDEIRQAFEEIRRLAEEEDRSIGDILVERGLATIEELTVSEEKRGDKYVADILASNMPEDTKNHLLLTYALNRRQSFREEGIIGPPKKQ